MPWDYTLLSIQGSGPSQIGVELYKTCMRAMGTKHGHRFIVAGDYLKKVREIDLTKPAYKEKIG